VQISSNNLIHAVEELICRGYDHDFRLNEGRLFDVTTDTSVDADEVSLDAAYRFEAAPGGMTARISMPSRRVRASSKACSSMPSTAISSIPAIP